MNKAGIAQYSIRSVKHHLKVLLNRPDPRWRFWKFQQSIHQDTWRRHDGMLSWGDECVKKCNKFKLPGSYGASDDPIVQQGFRLRQKIIRQFTGRYSNCDDIRILICSAPAEHSIAYYSLSSNLVKGLEVIGIPAAIINWNDPIEEYLEKFKPTVLLIVDHPAYLSRINWHAVMEYRKKVNLKLGLNPQPVKSSSVPFKSRLKWARENRVDFYYSFHSADDINSDCGPFFEYGYKVFNIEFGANPLVHYPVPGIRRDLNYVFLASCNPDKRPRYFSFLSGILKKYGGLLSGPGWSMCENWKYNPERDRYLYARACVGINLHVSEQIEETCELNERTYILAACGVPQLVDNPQLLFRRFSHSSIFFAQTPKEYETLFVEILNNPAEAQKRSMKALKDVFDQHTIFHRAEKFVQDLQDHFFN